ncbi:MAG: molybdopterin-dependent oxidoreductase [Candidatus Krumholzibacteriota bacterium]|nr:molybdopterin-dependent oxidoreductase [Candidatus Krumholzibacteriota bacterium]
MKTVGRSHPKLDGLGLLTGKPAYTDDLAPPGALVVKALRSPHAFARIRGIDTDAAARLPGVACVLTHADVPRVAITRAGQGYPEPSPRDRFILDAVVRYVGDEAAIVAAESEANARAALAAIAVDYEVLPPVLDFEAAVDHTSVIHPEPEAHQMFDIGFAPERNIAAAYTMEIGDVAEVLAASDVTVRRTYYTQAQAHVALEPHAAATYLDVQGRLNVISSTQTPFHTRRILSDALALPTHRIRVHKPRIGGGFGGKQLVHGELFAALVTLRTGRPARFAYTRREVFTSGSTRHAMRIDVALGAMRDGTLKAIDMDVLSNTGAYGEHALTVFMVAGSKSLPMYNRVEAVRYSGRVVYTNLPFAGAFRGYGAVQGNFALESAMDELAGELDMDPVALRERNMIREGETSPIFAVMGEGTAGVAQTVESCKLDQCVRRARELIGWDAKYPRREAGPHRVRGVGMAIAMQGSGIPAIDMAGAVLKLNDRGFFSLLVGATDLGTGSDTILAQMAAEVLGVPLERVTVYASDTDRTPFDTGAYASSTTYVSGSAVVAAAGEMKRQLVAEAARRFGVADDAIDYGGITLATRDGAQSVTLDQLSTELFYSRDQKQLVAAGSHLCQQSPPPYLCGCAEVEVDTETGLVTLVDFAAVADCGALINPNLAKVQIEGGVVQGVGMALHEEVRVSDRGALRTDSLMTYKIPTREDVPSIRVELVESYEPTGPFGAKSAGEIGIDAPPAAIANAVANAVGVRLRDLPLTPEKVLRALREKDNDA